MPIRDVVLVALIVGLLPLCFFRTWIGLLLWAWLAFMNPHQLTWGFANTLPLSQWVGTATLGGLVFSGDRKPFVWTRETILLLALWAWFTVTTMTALYPAEATGKLERVSKILLMTFLLIPFFQDRRRLRVLLLVVAGSIGFYGLKGGIWALLTGGENHVLGAPGTSNISSNNALALALNMCLPIFFYLAEEEPRRWLRRILYAMFFASIISVLFTYSRGGLLGLLAVLGVLFLNRKTVPHVALAALLLLLLAFGFAPEKWQSRMDTIVNYEEDGSANARFTAWYVAFRLATDNPITGGGFWAIANLETYRRYIPDYPYESAPDTHSLYFSLLAEHGFPGLILFTLFVVSTLVSLRQVRKRARDHEELRWASSYALMLQASITGYLVSGAFLSVAYFDLAYLLIMVAVLVKVLVDQQLEGRREAVAPEAGATGSPATRRAEPRPPLRRPRVVRTAQLWSRR
jgi:probable O-glycosylation ligase (exosortase A-associated)